MRATKLDCRFAHCLSSQTGAETKRGLLCQGWRWKRSVLAALGLFAGIGGTALGQSPDQVIITSIAYGGDGITGSTTLNDPVGVAVDISGNVYIADYANDVIREVSVSGTTTIVAGTLDTACSAKTDICGDGGLATSAELNEPSAVAVDRAGNLYIADRGDNRIREVYAPGGQAANPGYIVTIAGTGTPCAASTDTCGDGGTATPGLGAGGMLTVPGGVAVDSAGNIYIADSNDERIRAVYVAGTLPNVSSPTVGDIYTVAGNGTSCGDSTSTPACGDGELATSATLELPYAVVMDSAGNLYIADRADNRIREVSAGTGHIRTVAGDGIAGYSGDGGLGTGAELNAPYGVAVDSAGNVYIADELNSRIREVSSATGDITTVVGTSSACTNGTTGDGDQSTTTPCGDTGLATSGELRDPQGVAVDSAGNLIYIGDTSDQRVRAASLIDRWVQYNGNYTRSGNGRPFWVGTVQTLAESNSGDNTGDVAGEFESAEDIVVDSITFGQYNLPINITPYDAENTDGGDFCIFAVTHDVDPVASNVHCTSTYTTQALDSPADPLPYPIGSLSLPPGAASGGVVRAISYPSGAGLFVPKNTTVSCSTGLGRITSTSLFTTLPAVTLTGGGYTTQAEAIPTIVAGVVTGITVTSPGSGYTSAPTVGFSGGGGSGVVATANISSVVTSVSVPPGDGGSGYTSPPLVILSGGGYTTQATATATISGGVVKTITVTTSGSGYTSAPMIILSGGGYSTQATATATIATGVSSITVSSGGSGYGNDYAQFTCVLQYHVASQTETVGRIESIPYLGTIPIGPPTLGGYNLIESQASWYNGWADTTNPFTVLGYSLYAGALGLNPLVSPSRSRTYDHVCLSNVAFPSLDFLQTECLTDPASTGFTYQEDENVPGSVTSTLPGFVTLTSPMVLQSDDGLFATCETPDPWNGGGEWPSVCDLYILYPVTAAQRIPSVAAGFWDQGEVNMNLLTPSTGYYCSALSTSLFSPPLVSGQPPYNNGILGKLVSGSVQQIPVTFGGSGYSSDPMVTLAGGGYTTQATATATVSSNGAVTGFTVTNRGAGYTSAPSVNVSGGSGLSATASMDTVVTAITVTSGGSGYLSTPTVTITGGGGSGATATATVGDFHYDGNVYVGSITVTNPGTGYTSAPTVILTGGGYTTQATATASISSVVAGITVSSGGSGYSSLPGVNLSGGGGSGATATASVVGGAISGITVTASGSGYSSPPTVAFSCSGSCSYTTAATATADISVGALVPPWSNGGSGGAPLCTSSSDPSGINEGGLNCACSNLFTSSYPTQTISSLSTVSGGLVSVTLDATMLDGPAVGEWVTIAGNSNATYNGTFPITAVTSSTVFTVSNSSASGSPGSGGTINW